MGAHSLYHVTRSTRVPGTVHTRLFEVARRVHALAAGAALELRTTAVSRPGADTAFGLAVYALDETGARIGRLAYVWRDGEHPDNLRDRLEPALHAAALAACERAAA